MLHLDRLQAQPTTDAPFPHLTATGLLAAESKPALYADFPDPGRPGFFPVEELTCGPAFRSLLAALNGHELSRIVGEKLQRDLGDRPRMIVARRWSAERDGRPHTDGPDKVATALLYLNDGWAGENAGALRFLAGQDLDGAGSAPVPPVYGSFAAFARTDTSWHGHPPFTGERRVVQVFWLKDEAAARRKSKRHDRARMIKSLVGLMGLG